MANTKQPSNQKLSSRAANEMAAAKSQTPVNKNSKSQTPNARNEKESMPMSKMNYILMCVSLLLIVVGFVLMSGSGNEGSTFNYDVFSSTRIVVAPLITFLGFLCMIPAILYKGKKAGDDSQQLDDSASSPNVIVADK